MTNSLSKSLEILLYRGEVLSIQSSEIRSCLTCCVLVQTLRKYFKKSGISSISDFICKNSVASKVECLTKSFFKRI